MSRYGLEIRAATASDAPGLAELLGQAGPGLGDRLEAIRAGHGTALLALEWGPPSGLVVLHWYRTLDRALPVAQITLLLVGADARRRGIGRLLVKAASQAARVAGCGGLEMLVDAGPEMRAFCLATGFTEAGARFERALRKAL